MVCKIQAEDEYEKPFIIWQICKCLPVALSKLLGHYCSLHVFSADETALFWKKIPSSFLNSKV
jgi:hypothetical protein